MTLLLPFTVCAAVADASFQNQLAEINRRYEDLDYEQALEQVQRTRRGLLTADEQVTLQLYEGLLLCEMGKLDQGGEVFESALRTRPTVQLPIRVPPKVARLFESKRTKITEAAELGERLRREQEAQRPPPGDKGQGDVLARRGAAFRLRPEVVGFGDVSGLVLSGNKAGPPSFGGAVGITFGRGGWEGSARALLGENLALELEAGFVFGTGVFAPRVAPRGTVLPAIEGTHAYGGGVVVGGRLALSSRFTALVDVSGQVFDAPRGYRSLALLGAVGLGFNLL